MACCEFGSIGASRGLDLENPKYRFASSNHKVRRKSTETATVQVPGTGGTGRSQSSWRSGSQKLKLAVVGSLGALFAPGKLYANFSQNLFISKFLLSNQKWSIAVSSGLPLPLCGLQITNNTPVSKGPEGRLKLSYIYTLLCTWYRTSGIGTTAVSSSVHGRTHLVEPQLLLNKWLFFCVHPGCWLGTVSAV